MFGARQAAENYQRLEQVVRMLGIEKERMRLEWISAAESPKFVRVIREMTEQVRKLGPNPIGTRSALFARRKDVLDSEVEISTSSEWKEKISSG